MKKAAIGVVGLTAATFAAGVTGAPQNELVLVQEEIFDARVVRVASGDSLTVEYEHVARDLQFEAVLLPEDPKLRAAAADLVRQHVLGKRVRVHVTGYLQEGKVPVGWVALGKDDIRCDLLRAGLAVYCPRYAEGPRLEAAERDAKAEKRGLWADRGRAGPRPCDRQRNGGT